MDKYWRSMLYIFKEHGKLQRYMTTAYMDPEAGTVRIRKLKEESKPWSSSEKFMLELALHLYNPRNKVDLSGMDSLDSNNVRIAIEAIRIRYS